jgi:uncharacterized protein (TIGR03086 family)
MQREAVIDRAAAPTIEVVRAIATDQLDAPTPCRDYSVRQLVNHLLFWAPPLTGAARKDAVALPAASDLEVDLTGGDWSGRLSAALTRLAGAWADPSAWEGETRLGGPDRAPAAMIGGMVCTELVLHGWDLARASDQKPEWDEEVVAFAHRELMATAEQGRQLGVYGPEVAVPAAASTLDRALGLSGRDPGWSPA